MLLIWRLFQGLWMKSCHSFFDLLLHNFTSCPIFFLCRHNPIAVKLYDAIIALRPHWHTDDLTTGKIKVVMTASASDEGNLIKHHTNKTQRQALAQRIKDPENSLELVIVCNMWQTGFDAPCLHTMYIDKPLKGHGLMQAIARINRVYFEKEGGLIVDYLGLATELKKALTFYSQSGGEGELTLDQDVAVALSSHGCDL